jgi:hypothetical protein
MQAYADYNDLMKVTEEFLAGLIMELHGTYVVKYHPDGPGTERVCICLSVCLFCCVYLFLSTYVVNSAQL